MYHFNCQSCGGSVKTDNAFPYLHHRTCEECHELEGIQIDLEDGEITLDEARKEAERIVFLIVERGGHPDITFLKVAE